jgi:hypothetical protein
MVPLPESPVETVAIEVGVVVVVDVQRFWGPWLAGAVSQSDVIGVASAL